MSVTFVAARPATRTGTAISCYAYGSAADHVSATYPDEKTAIAAHAAAHAGNPDCDGPLAVPVPCFDTDADPRVNVAGANALELLAKLGLTPDHPANLCGSVPAEDMIGRVLLAQAFPIADDGLPSQDTTVPGGPRWIECGLQPGYWAARLTEIAEVAEFARTHQVPVVWS